MNKVLGLIAFARVPKRAAKVVLGLMSLAVMGLVASSSIAAPPAPSIARAEAKDLDADGYIDAILVTFSVPMDGSSVPAGFSVDGYALGSPAGQWVPGQQGAPPTQLRLNLVEKTTPGGDTDAKPTVKYRTAQPPAQSAPPLSEPMANADVSSVDTAGPVLMKVIARDLGTANTFIDALDEMRFEFSEKIKLASATQNPTAADRLQALDLGLRFQTIGNACPTRPNEDANPTNPNTSNKTNFPRLVSQTSPDPIVEPARGAASRVIRVQMGTPDAHLSSTITNVAVPGLCGVGIDPSAGTSIVDEATVPNGAVSMNVPQAGAGLRDITIAPIGVLFSGGTYQIGTRDLSPAVADGLVDGIAITFESNLVDSTINSDVLKSRFTVKNGAQSATVSGVETGAADDATLIVRIADVSWGGGVRPTVSFDGSGRTLKARVPTQGAQADVGSFGGTEGLSSIDQVGPAVLNARTLDTNANGLIDAIGLEMTETVAGGATEAGWTVGGQPATSLNGAGSALLTLNFAESTSLGTGATPSVVYDALLGNTTDVAGAELRSQTVPTADGAAPRVVKATTLASAANGKTDRLTFELSEPTISGGLAAAAFSIGGTPASGFGTSSIDPSGAANDALITVVVDKAGTGRFDAGVTSPLTDSAGNINDDDITIPAAQTIDAAAPVVTSLTTTPVGPVGAGTVTVRARFSELLDTSVVPTVAIGTEPVAGIDDLTHTDGFVNDDASLWEGTADFASADCAEQNGCSLSLTLTGAKDPSANSGVAATPVTVVVDTTAPSAPTEAGATALQETGAPSIGANTIGSRTKNLRITAAIIANQVNTTSSTAGGIAEVLVDGAALNPAARVTGIGASATGVTVDTAFANPAALAAAIPEGTHQLTVRLTDAAGNAATSAPVTLTADYSAVAVNLVAPLASTESYTGGDHICIQYDGDELATGLANVELRYSRDGGLTYPHVIATAQPIDAMGDCAGVGNAYDWTLPGMNTTGLRVRVSTIDDFANESKSASTSNMTVETVTQTVTSITTSVPGIVYGANVTINGTVSGNGFPVEGKTVLIQRRVISQSAFTTLATLTTGSNGGYSYTFKPAAGADYKATFARSGPYLASESALRRVTVAVNVTSAVNGTSLRKGQAFTIRGTVMPAHAGKKVWFQAYLSGKWVTLSQSVLGTANSYAFAYKSTSAKTLLFRVAFPTQDADHAWNISTRYMVRWS